MRKMREEVRYFVVDVVSIPVYKVWKKSEVYRMATGDGWGVMGWEHNEQGKKVWFCDDDCSAVLYRKAGGEHVVTSLEPIVRKDIPAQGELAAIVVSDSCGFTIYEEEEGDVKFFVTYDENGLIDTYRIGCWCDNPYDGEVEIKFSDLQSEEDHDTIGRASIPGTLEYMRKASLRTSRAERLITADMEGEKMTHATFEALQQRMTSLLDDTKQQLVMQCGIAKGHYKTACQEYGSHSEQAGKWDRIACATQIAYEALMHIDEPQAEIEGKSGQ